MPGAILFLGALCAAAFFELEGRPASSADFFKFRRIRSSWVFLLLIALTAVFAGFEIYFVSQGELYQSGIPFSGFAKLALLILFLSAIYLFNGRSGVLDTRKKILRYLVGGLAVLFAIINLIGVF